MYYIVCTCGPGHGQGTNKLPSVWDSQKGNSIAICKICNILNQQKKILLNSGQFFLDGIASVTPMIWYAV